MARFTSDNPAAYVRVACPDLTQVEASCIAVSLDSNNEPSYEITVLGTQVDPARGDKFTIVDVTLECNNV
ncbi:MAG: hypothetical protein SGARI_005806 [Bacillariaceae sp.]